VTRHRIDPLDALDSAGVVERLLDAEDRVVPAVRAALPQISAAADLITRQMRRGGRIAFVGAGTSGRLALCEAAELPGTFGLDPSTILIRVAGAGGRTPVGSDRDEDDVTVASADFADMKLLAKDVMVAVAASGSTPYTLVMARLAAESGLSLVAVVNALDSPMAALATARIEVPIGPEGLRDSTRLTAGTAQKLILNALTTAAMVALGHVHGDLMIDVVPANAKLRDRLNRIVADIAERPVDVARTALERCDWNARAAVLHLTAGLSPSQAAASAACYPTLRAAMEEFSPR
jgi:N-acetylmuramic acid 6-phosphate etherase